MVDMDVIVEGHLTSANVDEQFLLAVTKRGYGKRIPVEDFRTTNRGIKGVRAIKFKKHNKRAHKAIEEVTLEPEDTDLEEEDAEDESGKPSDRFDSLSCMRVCRAHDQVVLSTSRGTVIRQNVSDISIQSRTATGVRLQKLDEDDAIIMVDIVPMSNVPEIDTREHLDKSVYASQSKIIPFSKLTSV